MGHGVWAITSAWDFIASIGTVLAAFLAVGAMWQAGRLDRRSVDRLRRERRLDFELNVLRELADLLEEFGVWERPNRVITRLDLLPFDVVPITRARFHQDTTPEAKADYESAVGDRRGVVAQEALLRSGESVQDAMSREVRDAILERVERRDL